MARRKTTDRPTETVPEAEPAAAFEADLPEYVDDPDFQAVHDEIMTLPEGADAEIVDFPGDREMILVTLDPDDPDAQPVEVPSGELDPTIPFPDVTPAASGPETPDHAVTPAMTPLAVTYPPPGTMPQANDVKMQLSRTQRRALLGQDPA